jgi:hypothetical protein
MSYRVRFPLTQDLIDYARAEIRMAEELSDDVVADVARRVQFRAEKELRLAPGQSSRDDYTQPSREVLRATMHHDIEWEIARQLQPGAHELVRKRLRSFGLRDPALTEIADQAASTQNVYHLVRHYEPERSDPGNHMTARLRFAALSAFRKQKRRSAHIAEWDETKAHNQSADADAADAAIAKVELRDVRMLLGPERLRAIVQYSVDDTRKKTARERQAAKRIRAELRNSSIRDV